MKLNKLIRCPRHWLLGTMVALMLAENSVRALGAVHFQLYQVNAQIGYIPAANQCDSYSQ